MTVTDARYLIRLPLQYAGKKSGKDRLHHLVVHHLRITHAEELHTIAQTHQAESERVHLQGQWSALALRNGANVRSDLVELFMPKDVKAFLKLCGERKTLERIQHTLKTGKPLRN